MTNSIPDTNPSSDIDSFLDSVWMEQGLAKNTLSAYRSDLKILEKWTKNKNLTLREISRADLLDFISERANLGASSRSSARQLSTFRRFYNYLSGQEIIAQNPTLKISMPKLGRSLPKMISEEEVIKLIKAPVVKKPLGFRDRTMLEVLYATGLRVSELVQLKQTQLNLNQGFVRVLGKGNKERLVPLGRIAKSWLKRYLKGPIHEILGERNTDYLFPTRTSECIS